MILAKTTTTIIWTMRLTSVRFCLHQSSKASWLRYSTYIGVVSRYAGRNARLVGWDYSAAMERLAEIFVNDLVVGIIRLKIYIYSSLFLSNDSYLETTPKHLIVNIQDLPRMKNFVGIFGQLTYFNYSTG
jgi:hypothetical protein